MDENHAASAPATTARIEGSADQIATWLLTGLEYAEFGSTNAVVIDVRDAHPVDAVRSEPLRSGTVWFPGFERFAPHDGLPLEQLRNGYWALWFEDQGRFANAVAIAIARLDLDSPRRAVLVQRLAQLAADIGAVDALVNAAQHILPAAVDEVTLGVALNVCEGLAAYAKPGLEQSGNVVDRLHHLAGASAFNDSCARSALQACTRAQPNRLADHLHRFHLLLQRRYAPAESLNSTALRYRERSRRVDEILDLVASDRVLVESIRRVGARTLLLGPDDSVDSDWWVCGLASSQRGVEVLARLETSVELSTRVDLPTEDWKLRSEPPRRAGAAIDLEMDELEDAAHFERRLSESHDYRRVAEAA